MKNATVVLLGLLCLPPALPAGDDSPSQPKDFLEETIRRYILDHPEVLVESVQRFQEREQMARAKRGREAAIIRRTELLDDPDSPTAGTSNHPIQVVEFFDSRCVYCKRVHSSLLKLLEENPNVQIVFKEFPILGSESVLAAKASLAANRQKAYLNFHKALMQEEGPLTLQAIDRIATELGLDLARLEKDMETPEIRAAIERNYSLAKDLQVDSTPSFFVGGEVLDSARDIEEVRTLIAKAEARK